VSAHDRRRGVALEQVLAVYHRRNRMQPKGIDVGLGGGRLAFPQLGAHIVCVPTIPPLRLTLMVLSATNWVKSQSSVITRPARGVEQHVGRFQVAVDYPLPWA